MSRKQKKVCTTQNYIEHVLIVTSAVTAVKDNNYEKQKEAQ